METGTKVAIGVGAVIVIGGAITAYIFLNKKAPLQVAEPSKPSDIQVTGGSPETTSAIADAIKKGDIVVGDESPKGTSKCSAIRNDFDSIYSYKKCDGVWFTKKKASTSGWVSLADVIKWAPAIKKLNAKYPND